MPYNSSAFEKQLAKYRNEQASKALADTTPVDPHVVRARVNTGRGVLTPTANPLASEEGDLSSRSRKVSAQKPEDLPIDVKKAKKPFYRRGWFVFLAFSVLSTAAVPVFMKDEMAQLMGVVDSVQASTGVDPLSLDTYKRMFRGEPVAPAAEGAPAESAAAAAQPVTPAPVIPVGTDMHALVDAAQAKAAEVSSQGPQQSMQYIEEETKRLQSMAKDFDKQYGGAK